MSIEMKENKPIEIGTAVLWPVGMLLLLAAAFDVLPMEDNVVIFLALGCFVLAGVIKKFTQGCCCGR